MVTLKDIAEEAHVSLMTVSNVVNGKYSKVSKERLKEIQDILEKHHYIQNASARSLAKAKSNIVAIILRSVGNENSLSSPHNARLVGSIVRHIQDLGYYAMINLVEDCESIARSIRTWKVQAAIFLGMFDDEIEQIYELSSIPMVFIDSYSKIRQLSNVGIDDYKGGQMAAEYFIKHGHTKMAFVSPPNYDIGVVQHRLKGFTDVLTQHGLSLDARHCFSVVSDADPEQISQTVDQIMRIRNEITAMFVTSDGLAASLISGLHRYGVRIPEDLSVIGFDNTTIGTQIYPPLTTIAQDLELKARLTVDILNSCLKNPDASAESHVLDVRLVERESVRMIK